MYICRDINERSEGNLEVPQYNKFVRCIMRDLCVESGGHGYRLGEDGKNEAKVVLLLLGV